MDRNGEFQLEFNLSNIKSIFEEKFKINQSIFNNVAKVQLIACFHGFLNYLQIYHFSIKFYLFCYHRGWRLYWNRNRPKDVHITKVILLLSKVAWADSCAIVVITHGSAHANLCSTRMTWNITGFFKNKIRQFKTKKIQWFFLVDSLIQNLWKHTINSLQVGKAGDFLLFLWSIWLELISLSHG